MTPRAAIFAEAEELNFATIGVCPPDQLASAKNHFDEFIAQKQFGDMEWMQEKADRRGDPKILWGDVNSIIMLGLNYGPEHNPIEVNKHRSEGDISVYARGKDYHDVFKKRLKQLARFIHSTYGAEVKVFVDTAPVMEKPLAALAGIGWQGKHTNLVSRDYGSWLFLGAIYTSLKLDADTPHKDHCASCSACLDACPTKAFTAPYKLDARRCISYLTIEHKSHIDAEFRTAMGSHIYGCDDCLSVCPWNKFAKQSSEQALLAKTHLNNPKLDELLKLDDQAFREFFKATPIKRTGRDRFMRNVLIAAGNSGDKELTPNISPHLADPNPIVRAMGVWALKQLLNNDEFDSLKKQYFLNETDSTVIAEWG